MIALAGLTDSAAYPNRLMIWTLKMNLNGSGPKKLMLFVGMIKEDYLC